MIEALSRLRWMSDGAPFVLGERGALLVFVGEPDADSALRVSRIIADEFLTTGRLVVFADATGTEMIEGAQNLRVARFWVMSDLAELVGEFGGGELVVAHALDAWPDWDSPDAALGLANATAYGLTVILHTRRLGDGSIFGRSVFEWYASAVLLLPESGNAKYLFGRELMTTVKPGEPGAGGDDG